MIEYLGSHNGNALFSNGELSAIIDTNLNMVVEFGAISNLQHASWDTSVAYTDSTFDLATAALSEIEGSLTASVGRMYTIPEGVKNEAIKALKWRKEENRGGTPVGLNTARTLAKGGQIGIKKVRHIAKYFPRHEVDKKGKGWEPGEDNFPSNGRIAWALWGGDAARRWASAIVEREDKKSMTAGGYEDVESYDNGYSDVDAFKEAYNLDANYGPEFLARVRLDGSGIDRLYKIDINGHVFVWDDCAWDDLGHVDGDIYTYDSSLDDPYDQVEKTHVMLDPDSAIVLSALLQESPFKCVQVDELDPEESALVFRGMEDVDYDLLDRVITAAGAAPVDPSHDGNYTPEERGQKANKQPRDAGGKFAKAGNRVVVGGDTKNGLGVITKVDSKSGKVDVKLDNGKSISVDSKMTKAFDEKKQGQMAPAAPTAAEQAEEKKSAKPVSTEGILGQPKPEAVEPKAMLSDSPAPLTKPEIDQMFVDWAASVTSARAASSKAVTAAGAPAKEEQLTPKTSDVTPKYIAIVSPDDPQAVMDVVALVPATATTTEPLMYARKDGKWVLDEQTLKDLKSATPPPVVVLDTQELLNNILKQVDKIENVSSGAKKEETKEKPAAEATAASAYQHLSNFWAGVPEAAILAAGGLDRNRGNAEELRHYWTHGKGALKIRWGTPGDWTRCVRHLSKYMGPRAKGYCQLRHKEATGVYTGSRFNPGKDDNRSLSADMFENQVIETSYRAAEVASIKERMGLVAAALPVKSGAKFTIPLLIPENLESGDGRKFTSESIDVRELPLPLLWQIKTGEGHMGSVVVGRIDHMERIENGIGNAYGVFDNGPYGREAERLVRNGFIRGVSADLDQFEAKEVDTENAEDGDEVSKQKLTINHARVMAATIVAKPAFQECSIIIDDSNDDLPISQEEDMVPEDGIYEETVDTFTPAEALTASGFLASPIPVTPPEQWFHNPGLTKPTPITVEPDGRIYGHIAAWHVNHIGMPRSTRPPRSKSKYAYFHTGVCRTDSGKDIPVGQLTLAGGHADLHANAAQAAKHYDDTASAIADVHAGEDAHGIWVAGSVRPDATEMDIRKLRASAPSGDWRPINGSLELVAVCQVNVPGFPIARALVASGKVFALVAAGASYFAMMKSQHVTSLVERAAKLSELSASSADLMTRFETQFGYIPRSKREDLAKSGAAMKDGSFPIRNVEDLKNAIQAHGRAKDVAAAKKHIIKRARALGKYNLIPDEWKKAKTIAASAQVEDMRERALVASAVAELAKISEEERGTLAEKGYAMPDGAYPIRNEDDLKNAIKAFGRAKESERAQVRRHIMKRARQLKAGDLIPEQWKNSHTMAVAASNLERMRAVVASLRTEFAADEEVPTAEEIQRLADAKAEADKQTAEEVQRAEDIAAGKTTDVPNYDEEGRSKYTPKTQPRDAKGKYRKVLARLKHDLGDAGLQKALLQVQKAENLEFAGNYEASQKASSELLGIIDRLDTNALNPQALENVQNSARELGKVISNLPLPFGAEAEKMRFSDLPAGLKDLIGQMMDRVEAKIGKKDADVANADLKSYMSGADVYSQGEIQSQMSKLLRLLT
jgi:hypothetical protein